MSDIDRTSTAATGQDELLFERERRVARNEIFFREVNEAIRHAARRLLGDHDQVEMMCECGRSDCTQLVSLPLEEYRAVRASAQDFMVAPGHEMLEFEVIVATHPGYNVVRKIGVSGTYVARHTPSTQQ